MPVYPPLVAAAFILNILSNSGSGLEAVQRPLVIAVVLVGAVQLVLSMIVRDRHLGAMIAGEAVLLPVAPELALLLAVASAVLLIWLARRGRRLVDLALQRPTRFLNAVALLTLAISTAGAAAGGALTLHRQHAAIGDFKPGQPDIYVILLDGHPRADTIESKFGFSERPFLDEMESLGFDVADQSHSNYNITQLTLVSMFNMSQVQTLLPDPPADPRFQVRALSTLINNGSGLDDLRARGYEIVSIPSPFTWVTLYNADRIIDGGTVTEFEMSVIGSLRLAAIAPDAYGAWVADQLRTRIHGTFDALEALAAERADRPRFVFAHVMSPHPPTLFSSNGSPQSPWPCFPRTCDIWYGGQQYGDDIVAPTAGQIQWLDGVVYETVKSMVKASKVPPVIVVLSDHGNRHDLDDPDELLHNMFMALTPGKPDLFPENTSPINTLPRILNAYAGANLPLAGEESYWLSMRRDPGDSLFDLRPWVP